MPTAVEYGLADSCYWLATDTMDTSSSGLLAAIGQALVNESITWLIVQVQDEQRATSEASWKRAHIWRWTASDGLVFAGILGADCGADMLVGSWVSEMLDTRRAAFNDQAVCRLRRHCGIEDAPLPAGWVDLADPRLNSPE